MAEYDADGRQIPDPEPIEVPAKLRIPKSDYEKIAEQVTMEMSRINEDRGYESFEDSMDFDVEDDPEDVLDFSPYELSERLEEYLLNDREAFIEHQRKQHEAPLVDEHKRQDEAESAAQKEISE